VDAAQGGPARLACRPCTPVAHLTGGKLYSSRTNRARPTPSPPRRWSKWPWPA